jgi:methionyl-tRNA formyltransferase
MVLDELEKAGLLPALIVTLPPKKQGRGLQEVDTDVATWARQRNVPLAYDWADFEKSPPTGGWDVAIVVDYGKILPQSLLSIPKKGFLNMHPSLLPRLRGASPMRSAILNNEQDTGVSVILIDEEMDHGPLVAQKKAQFPEWPLKNSELESILVPLGGMLLAQILREYVAGNIEPVEQNHDVATYSGKFTKEDGLLDLKGDVLENLRKIYAFEGWPGTYAFFERAGKKIRVAILDAHIEGKALVIDSVKPEGKNMMPYEEFARSGAKPL